MFPFEVDWTGHEQGIYHVANDPQCSVEHYILQFWIRTPSVNSQKAQNNNMAVFSITILKSVPHACHNLLLSSLETLYRFVQSREAKCI